MENKIDIDTRIDIFKYQTQITIHGLFPELNNSYLYNYKYLFQNKNKSIGVKYNAIDIEKKVKIAKYSSICGWAKYHNSSEFSIFKQKRIDNNEQYQATLIEYNDIANRIDKDLFFGRVYIYTGNSFGRIYLVINIELNAILYNNIIHLFEISKTLLFLNILVNVLFLYNTFFSFYIIFL